MLIDASILIAYERGDIDLHGRLGGAAAELVAIASITASELLHGIHRANTEARRATREAFVEGLLDQLPVIAFDLAVARVHARIWAQLARDGTMIGAHDTIVAATAIACEYQVVTRDIRHFGRIPELSVDQW